MIRTQPAPGAFVESLSNAFLSVDALASADDYRRRRATAVLCPVFGDIKDSTELLEALGEVSYGNLRTSLDEAVRLVIERDGEGVVLKTLGDGFLAAFSEPSTAVERSLEIQGMLRDDVFSLRIGVDMGQVALKRTSGILADIFGRHVNRASRIQSCAAPGSVLTSFPVYDSCVGWLHDIVRWTHREPTRLKGFDNPISLHEAIPIVAPPSRVRLTGTGAPQWWPEPLSRRETGRPSATRHALVVGTERVEPARVRWYRRRETQSLFNPLEDAFLSLQASAGRGLIRQLWPKTVLWVDDQPGNNRQLVKQFADAGLRVVIVVDTSSAIRVLLKERISAVISDMRRGRDPTAGLELLRKMRNSGFRLPFFVYTSPRTASEYSGEALQLGALTCTSGAVSLIRALATAVR